MPPDQLVGGGLHGLDIEVLVESVGLSARAAGCAVLSRWSSGTPSASPRGEGRSPRPPVAGARSRHPGAATPRCAGPSRLPGHVPRPGERDHLSSGMHPGVRPTGRGDPDASTTIKVGQRTFQLSLDGPTARLGLEAGELGAVIFDPCAVPHGAALSGGLRCGRSAAPCGVGPGRLARPARAGRSGRHRRPEGRA